VIVSGVQVGGIASNAGLRRGDILLKLDETIIENLAHFKELYDSAIESNQKLVMLWVKRGALTRFVLVKQSPGTESEEVAEPEVLEVGGTEGE
jgi:S1-C subfamily serine protease